MPIKTVTKKKTQSKRWQITLPKEPGINKRITSLSQKFEGMDLVEIAKLALITLDKQTEFESTETGAIKQNARLYSYLLNTKQQIEDGSIELTTFASLDDLIAKTKDI
jgi:hypothetical protein